MLDILKNPDAITAFYIGISVGILGMLLGNALVLFIQGGI
jgi:hypothetical protein